MKIEMAGNVQCTEEIPKRKLELSEPLASKYTNYDMCQNSLHGNWSQTLASDTPGPYE